MNNIKNIIHKNDITIVTAFYDLGRGDWKHFSRKTDYYFECFERLCQLKNQIIVFSESKFKSKFDYIIENIKSDLIVVYQEKKDIFDRELIDRIKRTQELKSDQEKTITVPEQWCPEYVYLTTLKTYFCCTAIQQERVNDTSESFSIVNDTVAWIDFGYVRKEKYLPESRLWKYAFRDKIHLWSIRNIPQRIDIKEVIKTFKAYIMANHIIASKNKWFYLKESMNCQLEKLLSNSLIDDEQTLLLMAYLENKKEYVLYREIIDYSDLDWFFIFKYYNDCV